MADYYISTTGSDSDTGGISDPWATIQHALQQTGSGDTITVTAGTYKEYVYFYNSGASGSERIIKGETSGSTLLTTIDPGETITGWTQAPEVSSLCYKKTVASIGFEPSEITVNGKRIGVMNSFTMDDDGMDILAYASDKTETMETTGVTVNWWDGIECTAGVKDSILYIRFKNGDNPSGFTIKAYKEDDTLNITACNYNTIQDLNIICADTGICFDSNAHHNTIDSCDLKCGRYRIALYYGSHDNVIKNTSITTNYYGYNSLGPWLMGTDNIHGIREHIYRFFKYKLGHRTTDDDSIYLLRAGDDNVINDNTITQCLVGSRIQGTSSYITDGTLIYNNTLSGIDSVGLLLAPCSTNISVYNNTLNDCAIGIRLHEVNYDDSVEISLNIHDNTLTLPANIGRHIFINWLSDGDDTKQNTYLIEDNTMNYGYYGLYNARHSSSQQLCDFTYTGNKCSAHTEWYSQ